MSIKFACPGCGKELTAPDGMAGRKAKCKACTTISVIPQPAAGDDIDLVPLDDEPPVAPPPRPAAGPAPIRVTPRQLAAAGPSGGIQVEDDDIPLADYAPPPTARPAPGVGLAPAGGAGGAPALQQRLRAINGLVQQGRYLEATQALRPLAQDARGNPGYHYLAGMAFSGLGNHPHALDHLVQAVEGGVRNPEIYAAKGQAELALGRATDAISSLDTALDLAGTDVPDYMADLARAYDAARMPRDAGATWAALAKINPNHPALLERERQQLERQSRRQQEQAAQAMVQMQKEQRASDTACWICIILRILLECL